VRHIRQVMNAFNAAVSASRVIFLGDTPNQKDLTGFIRHWLSSVASMQTDMSLGKDNGAMVLNSNRRIDKVVVIDALNRCRWREVT
jgi:hypothetical protein